MSISVDSKKEKINIKETLFRNMFNLLFLVLAIGYLVGFLNIINKFPDETMKFLATIVAMFTSIKLFSWCTPDPIVIDTITENKKAK